MKKLKKLIFGMGLLCSTCAVLGHEGEKKHWNHERRCPMHDLHMKNDDGREPRGFLFDPAKAKIGHIAELIEDSICSLEDVYFIQKVLDEKKHKILSHPHVDLGDHRFGPCSSGKMPR